MAKSTKDQKDGLRPPIIAVLGHVDHGKTTLLDSIRKSNVVSKEFGGITQGIGASVVTTRENNKITFIDTPGHAAFADMRSQGAQASDVALLVIAANDGIKPQTKEALKFIKEAGIPYIIVATKTDLPGSNIERLKQQVKEEKILIEGEGGDIPLVEVSGKTGKGVDELLEIISLVSQLNNIKGNVENDLSAVIIETGKDKRGPYVSLVVRDGNLKVGDEITTQNHKAKVRGLFSWEGESIKEIGPGLPVQVLGFSQLPKVGSKVWDSDKKQITTQLSIHREVKRKMEEDDVPVVLKARNVGSLNALVSNVGDKIFIVEANVGEINESDVFIAKSASADIYALGSTASGTVKRLALNEGVEIFRFDIIYELFETLEKKLEEGFTVYEGKAKIIQIFPYNKKKVAGCKILEGIIKKKARGVISRDDKEYGKITIRSMRKEKNEIEEAKQGEECGIIFSPQLEFEVGDVISSVRSK